MSDEMLREFQHWLHQHRRYTFLHPWSDSPIVLFLWEQLRIQLLLTEDGHLVLGEVAIPLPEWVARFHTRLRSWPSASATGEDLLRILARALQDMDSSASDSDPLQPELGEGD